MTKPTNQSFSVLIYPYTELKKDPGVPRLPDLKVRSAEQQRRRSVRSLRSQALL